MQSSKDFNQISLEKHRFPRFQKGSSYVEEALAVADVRNGVRSEA